MIGTDFRGRVSKALWVWCLLLYFATASETESSLDLSSTYSAFRNGQTTAPRNGTPFIQTPSSPSTIQADPRQFESPSHCEPVSGRQDTEVSGTALALERSLHLDDDWSASREGESSEYTAGMSKQRPGDPSRLETPLEQIHQLIGARHSRSPRRVRGAQSATRGHSARAAPDPFLAEANAPLDVRFSVPAGASRQVRCHPLVSACGSCRREALPPTTSAPN